MAFGEILPVSVLICTNNRMEKLERCILSILNQTFLPQEVLIADSSDVKIDVRRINNLFDKDGKICTKVYKINKKLIPFSRNLLMSKAKNSLCLFVDDDVVLNKEVLNRFYYFMINHPEVTVVGGISRPDKKNIFSEYMYQVLFDKVLKNYNQTVSVDYCPTMIFGYKNDFFLKHKIYFDEKIKNLEDIDLCLQIKKKGGKIVIDKKIKGVHSYRDNLVGFYRSFFNYYCYIDKIYQKHNVDFFDLKEFVNEKKKFSGWKYLFSGDNDWLSMIRKSAMFMAMRGKTL